MGRTYALQWRVASFCNAGDLVCNFTAANLLHVASSLKVHETFYKQDRTAGIELAYACKEYFAHTIGKCRQG